MDNRLPHNRLVGTRDKRVATEEYLSPVPTSPFTIAPIGKSEMAFHNLLNTRAGFLQVFHPFHDALNAMRQHICMVKDETDRPKRDGSFLKLLRAYA